MLIKVIWYDESEEETLETIVGSESATFGICDALDNCKYVRQWQLDRPEDTFVWYRQGKNFKKLVIDPCKGDFK